MILSMKYRLLNLLTKLYFSLKFHHIIFGTLLITACNLQGLMRPKSSFLPLREKVTFRSQGLTMDNKVISFIFKYIKNFEILVKAKLKIAGNLNVIFQFLKSFFVHIFAAKVLAFS